MVPNKIKAFTAFVDGRRIAQIKELTLPKFKIKTEDYRPGGADMPVAVDMGMEAISADMTFEEYDRDALKLVGILPGGDTPVTFRGSIEGDAGTEAVVITMRGMFSETDPGNWKAGDDTSLKLTLALRYYRYEQGGEEIIEIDVENMVRKIGGVDQLAERRAALNI